MSKRQLETFGCPSSAKKMRLLHGSSSRSPYLQTPSPFQVPDGNPFAHLHGNFQVPSGMSGLFGSGIDTSSLPRSVPLSDGSKNIGHCVQGPSGLANIPTSQIVLSSHHNQAGAVAMDVDHDIDIFDEAVLVRDRRVPQELAKIEQEIESLEKAERESLNKILTLRSMRDKVLEQNEEIEEECMEARRAVEEAKSSLLHLEERIEANTRRTRSFDQDCSEEKTDMRAFQSRCEGLTSKRRLFLYLNETPREERLLAKLSSFDFIYSIFGINSREEGIGKTEVESRERLIRLERLGFFYAKPFQNLWREPPKGFTLMSWRAKHGPFPKLDAIRKIGCGDRLCDYLNLPTLAYEKEMENMAKAAEAAEAAKAAEAAEAAKVAEAAEAAEAAKVAAEAADEAKAAAAEAAQKTKDARAESQDHSGVEAATTVPDENILSYTALKDFFSKLSDEQKRELLEKN